jgi:hypothetical protein
MEMGSHYTKFYSQPSLQMAKILHKCCQTSEQTQKLQKHTHLYDMYSIYETDIVKFCHFIDQTGGL